MINTWFTYFEIIIFSLQFSTTISVKIQLHKVVVMGRFNNVLNPGAFTSFARFCSFKSLKYCSYGEKCKSINQSFRIRFPSSFNRHVSSTLTNRKLRLDSKHMHLLNFSDWYSETIHEHEFFNLKTKQQGWGINLIRS